MRSAAALNHDRAAMIKFTGELVLIFKFKMVESVEQIEPALATAIAQIRDQGYAEI